MPAESLVDRLAAMPLLQSVERRELEWLAEHGAVRALPAGTVARGAGQVVDEMWLIFTGHVGFRLPKAAGSRRIMEAGAGEVVGALPFSRALVSPGDVVIEEDVTALVLHRDCFPELMRDLPGVLTALVHSMLDRSRTFRSIQQNEERLESLSRLASGFAHELNNPASAAARTARSLVELIEEQERSARDLAAARLSDDELAAVDAVRRDCQRSSRPRTALEAADREDDISDWLAHHGLSTDSAANLAASDITLPALDDLVRTLPPAAAGIAIRWVASGCAVRLASRQIESATGRIHHLVDAVKGFTFMDRQGVPEELDVARGLADTLAMLDGKARAKSATVQLETADGLPRLRGFGSEINQVWEKLVDNALDAVGDRGHVTIMATTRDNAILVRVADDGPGIPEEVRSRIFDPFFTTKPQGQGTGLGLDMARRIVRSHGGDIEFSTQPGRTVFRVQLPLTGARTGPGVAV